MKKMIALVLSIVMAACISTGCLSLLGDVVSQMDLSDFLEQDYEYNDASSYESDTDYPEPEYNATDSTWSVFIYLCGTDLESKSGAATTNLAELLKVTSTDSASIIIQTGGTKTWQNSVVDSTKLQRYKAADGGLYLLEEKSLSSMGSADTLGNFLSWGVKNYPADKYMLVLWDHGGGSVDGVVFDERYSYDSLTLDELSEGVKAAGVTFEVIGFDACLMSTLETASALAPYAKYMVASEEYEPGGGWDYTGWAKYLYAYPNCSGEELGKAICDTYYAKCRYSGDSAMATLSVTDLKKVPALVTAFDNMAQEMTGVTEDISELRTLAQGAMKAENYGGNTASEGYTNMVDLGDLAINTEDVLPNTADKLLDALFSTVLYQVKGSSRSQANGLSVFFPLGVNAKICDSYAEIAVSGSYLRFVDAVTTSWEAPDWVDDISPAVNSVQAEDYNVDAESYIDDDGYFVLQITEGLEAVQSVMFSLYSMDYEYNEYMLLGLDNDIDADWENGIFTDNFRGVWPTIEGQYCAPTLIAETTDYNLYSIPCLLNGEQTNLRAAYIWDSDDTGHFEIYGAWAGLDDDTGMSARDIVKLRDGDEVTLLFDGTNWDSGKTTTYAMGSFTVKGDVTMVESDLFDGEYLYQYEITDVFGQKLYSATVILEVKNGEINIYETDD